MYKQSKTRTSFNISHHEVDAQLLPAGQGLTQSTQRFFGATTATTTNLSSGSFPPALITSYGYSMLLNISLLSFRLLYYLHVLPSSCILMHGESLGTVQALVSGSQALLSYQDCFSH